MSGKTDKPSICSNCGRSFECGIAAGKERCWCMEMPKLAPESRSGAQCLCPACLQALLEKQGKE